MATMMDYWSSEVLVPSSDLQFYRLQNQEAERYLVVTIFDFWGFLIY
jgi:hypothetical protein